MPKLSHNDAALLFDGIDAQATWVDAISPDFKNDTQETTAGSGSKWRTFNPGLNSWTMKLTIVWDTAVIDTIKHLFQVGAKWPLTWGPDGSASGDPKFEAPIIVEGVKEISQSIEESKWMYELALKGDGTPTSLIANGDTF